MPENWRLTVWLVVDGMGFEYGDTVHDSWPWRHSRGLGRRVEIIRLCMRRIRRQVTAGRWGLGKGPRLLPCQFTYNLSNYLPTYTNEQRYCRLDQFRREGASILLSPSLPYLPTYQRDLHRGRRPERDPAATLLPSFP